MNLQLECSVCGTFLHVSAAKPVKNGTEFFAVAATVEPCHICHRELTAPIEALRVALAPKPKTKAK